MSNINNRERLGTAIESTGSIDKKRWLTLFLQIIVGSITAYIYCVNIYIGPLSEQRGWNPQTIVLAFSLMTAVGIVASIVGGSLRDRLGNKWCLKFGGLGFGVCVILSSIKASVWFFVLGQGVGATFFMYIVYVSQMANIGELFPDRKGMALGIGIGGINLGSALVAPFAEWLLRLIGISPSIILQGILYGGLTIICGFLIIEAPKGYKPANWMPAIENADENKNSDDGFTWKQTVKTPGFWIMSICFAVGGIIIMGVSSNLSLIAQECLAVSTSKAAWMYTLFSLFGGVGGFIFGSIGDKFGSMRTWTFIMFLTAVATFALVLFGLSSFTFFIIVISYIGLVMGAMQTFCVASLMDGFGQKNFGVNFGLIQILGAVGTLYGSQISVSMAPADFFTTGATCTVIAGIAGILTIILVNRARKKKVL